MGKTQTFWQQNDLHFAENCRTPDAVTFVTVNKMSKYLTNDIILTNNYLSKMYSNMLLTIISQLQSKFQTPKGRFFSKYKSKLFHSQSHWRARTQRRVTWINFGIEADPENRHANSQRNGGHFLPVIYFDARIVKGWNLTLTVFWYWY